MTKTIYYKPINTVILLVASLLAVLAVSLLLGAREASALSGSEFNAGRIIDDSVFYDSGSMSAGQIQQFLNAKVPTCDTNGTQIYSGSTTRAQYGRSRGAPPPYICLKSYTQNVPTTINGGSDLCTGSISGSRKSAAQIIYDVARACTINPQVLLVLLQKEQSLVTDDWPWPIQYRSATGYGCPDTAPCDSQYYGFFNQVYQAAKGYKRYRANPANYNYRAGRNNTILWHPNGACGTSTVFIQNQATAGLYIYTPYRPNAAALNNLYGTGNSCSSYGNRNFWRMFRDWFGSTSEFYAATITSKKIFSDEARANELSSMPALVSGQKIYVTVRVKNTGTRSWDKSFVKVGTVSPLNRNSKFADSSWLSEGRPARLVEQTVAPGGTGTFNFSLTAPAVDGTYVEKFHVVAENKTWMKDAAGFNFTIPVSNPYNASIISNLLYKDVSLTEPNGGIIKTGETVYWRIRAKNIGSQTWSPPLIRVGTSDPRNRTSVFNNGSWFSSNRPTVVEEANITPGQVGSFTFAVTAPGAAGIYEENFELLAQGISWMPNSPTGLRLRVVDNLAILRPSYWIERNEGIYSAKHKLVLQGDGNLVLYGSGSRALWSTGTRGANKLVLQGDGNLVLYGSNGRPLWHTGTRNSNRLSLQSDGNLVLYGSNGRPYWSTGTR